MEKLVFKTTVNCGSCVAKITPAMNELDEVESWKVDTENPDKILTVEGEELTPELIIDTLEKVGYKAESI